MRILQFIIHIRRSFKCDISKSKTHKKMLKLFYMYTKQQRNAHINKDAKKSFPSGSPLSREKVGALHEYHCYGLLPRVHVYTVLLWQCECNWATSIFCRICLPRSLKSTAETTKWRTVATLASSLDFCHWLAIWHDTHVYSCIYLKDNKWHNICKHENI